jgi:hypothetical protein
LYLKLYLNIECNIGQYRIFRCRFHPKVYGRFPAHRARHGRTRLATRRPLFGGVSRGPCLPSREAPAPAPARDRPAPPTAGGRRFPRLQIRVRRPPSKSASPAAGRGPPRHTQPLLSACPPARFFFLAIPSSSAEAQPQIHRASGARLHPSASW